MPTLFISGTDTDAGKTVVTAALAAYLRHSHPQESLALCKPLQTGMGDREYYQQVFQLQQTADELNPLHFKAPLAPPLAAEQENRPIDLALVWQTLQGLEQRHRWLLIEGLGGLGSPVTRELTVADLARDWRLPTLLVVPVRLGAIGQAVAHGGLARHTGVPLQGIVLNCCQPLTAAEQADWAPADLIQGLTGVPVLGYLPFVKDRHQTQALAAAAAELELESILPLTPRLKYG